MSNNTLGRHFCITSFGESHGEHVGVIIDGCIPGLQLDLKYIQYELDRRKPGQSNITTSRKEDDSFRITSGIFKGITTGAPICILIPNQNARPNDYDHLKDVYRPSHADFTYEKKYGIRDYAGGGRSSARITAGWVAAGAIAKMILQEKFSVDIQAYVKQIHSVSCPDSLPVSKEAIEASIVRCPDPDAAKQMIAAIESAKEQGDSLGGIVRCSIQHSPVGVGEPVFQKLQAQLAHAMMSINASKGVQFGSGFDSVLKKGSELNDAWTIENGQPKTQTNNSGGIQGGISNGMDIYFDVAFKPTATINHEQDTLNKDLEPVKLSATGRHDPCVVPRAVSIVEAMAALVMVDNLLHRL
ncbi:MAG: chorismate synthase [Bacteroidia bacterium]|nr:chorismate synthase [Bacteroidia bacterium]